MPLLLLIVAAVLLLTAFRNTTGDLANALKADVPGFTRWAGAVLALGALGYVPGLRTPSRLLLALVAVVVVLRNYQGFLDGFATLKTAGTGGTAAVPAPGQAYAANPASPVITAANVTGTTTGATGTAVAAAQPFDPTGYLAQYQAILAGHT